MKVATLLRDLPIGADAAENDTNLDSYFVRTSAYWNVICDHADVILGAKGSGKSSIARHLCGGKLMEVELSSVDIIPAFNLQGVVAFRKLGTDFDHPNEASLRVVWLAYIVSLAGNHIVKNYPALEEAASIRAVLRDADLLDKDNRQVRIWDKILQLARQIMPRRLQAQVSVDSTGMPSVGASVEFGDQQKPLDKIDLSQFDWYNLLEVVGGALSKVDRSCWIIFDRLDEAFAENRTLEKSALRALLRMHLDLNSSGKKVQSKLFLRTDLLDRITSGEGFVNATHARRMTISWEGHDVVDLISRRVLESRAIVSAFSLSQEQLKSQTGRRDIYLKLLPKEIENQDTISWLLNHTSDATGSISPRNIVTLLRLARDTQMQAAFRNDVDFNKIGSLLSANSLRTGWLQLSEARLQDTIYAEFNQLRPYLEKLVGRYSSYSDRQLARVLGLELESEQFRQTAIDLKYAGLMSQSANGIFRIPLLYRPAMRANERGKPRSIQKDGDHDAAVDPLNSLS